MGKAIIESLTKLVTIRVRWQLRTATSRRLKTLEAAIRTSQDEYERAGHYGMEHYQTVYNAGLFVMLLSYDLTIQRADQMQEFNALRKNYYSRQLCLLVYEALEDLPSVLGRGFRESLTALFPEADAVTHLNKMTKQLATLRSTQGKYLNALRGFAIAHRDHNAIKQALAIRVVDYVSIAQIAGDLDLIISELVKWLTLVVQNMGNWRVIANHMDFTKPPFRESSSNSNSSTSR